MNAKFELEAIGQNSLVAAFESEKGIKTIVENIQMQVDEQVKGVIWDLSKKKNRDLIASLARKVASSKTAIDAAGKQLKEQYTVITSKIDADRKFARDTLDAERDRIRQPLTDWENAEKDRIKQHEEAVQFIKDHVPAADANALKLKGDIEFLENLVIGSQYEGYEEQAKLAKFETLEALRKALAEREKYEAAQAELERHRQAEILRQQQEREAQIAREAAENATREAEEKARYVAERVQREKAELEQREARLKAEKEAAELRAQQASETERKRIESEQFAQAEAERKAEEVRLADKEHRRIVNREVLDAIKSLDLGVIHDEQIKKIIGAIIGGLVPHVSIKY